MQCIFKRPCSIVKFMFQVSKIYSKHLPNKLMQLFSTNITICFMIMKPVVLVLDTFLEIV